MKESKRRRHEGALTKSGMKCQRKQVKMMEHAVLLFSEVPVQTDLSDLTQLM